MKSAHSDSEVVSGKTACAQSFGDELARNVAWTHGPELSRLAGQPVRLRFVMKDADLYAIRFRPDR